MKPERPASRIAKTPKPVATKAVTKPRASRSKKPAIAPIDAVPASASSVVSDEAIAVRAYEIFLARKCAGGDPVADWLQAERELRPNT
jgi:hypothetical protein